MIEGTNSAYERPITIMEVINKIDKKEYLLPAIQREFVWKSGQIIRLFDSLMKSYPIGSFLFWSVEKKIKDYQFYEFIRNYHVKDNKHNPKASLVEGNKVISILDGQQRLTALYIGLKGSYAFKIKYKRKDAYPSRRLYLNLLSDSPDFELKYDFQFLTDKEALKFDDDTFWFRVGDILDFEALFSISEFISDKGFLNNEKAKFAHRTLHILYQAIREKKLITYYLETSQKIEKVLNIFIRVNSGGTQLSYSDLLLSIATAQWETKDAREEITKFVDEINEIGEGFEFNKDFVLKSCLVLSGLDVAFKVGNFKKDNMERIEAKWDDIQEAIRLSTELVSTFGYNHTTLTSNNAIIPIAYYLLKKGNPYNFSQSESFFEDRKNIKKWLRTAILKRNFSGQPDNVLRPIRSIIDAEHNQFPFNPIIERFKGRSKTFVYVEDDIEQLLQSRYGKAHTFTVLATLYPTLKFKDRIHIDHIHPRSFFTASQLTKRGIPQEEQSYYKSSFNDLSNLQLLEGVRNEEKSNKDFETWIIETYHKKEDREAYMRRNYIPLGIDLSFGNFRKFYAVRKKLMKQKLKEVLL